MTQPSATNVSQIRRGLPFPYDTPLPEGTRITPVRLFADDGAESSGWLYEPAGARPKTVMALMHPRGEFGRHYAIPGLVRAGYAAFGQNSRYLNNDTEAIHERLLLDVAAGMRWLRAQGFERVVLAGNSGGGSLYATYHALATADKTRHELAGTDHYLRPTARRADGSDPREELNEVMTAWLSARFAR